MTTLVSAFNAPCRDDTAFLTLDAGWHFTSMNAAAETLLGRNRDSLIGRVAWDEFPEFVGGPSYREYHRALAQHCAVLFEEFYPPGRWLEVRAYPTGDGLAVYFDDVTSRKDAMLELTRVNRALQLISRCNEAVIRATQEPALLERICQIAVETGGYRSAWVAYRSDDENKSLPVQTFATSEADEPFLRQLDLSWSADRPQGQGPAGQAIRSGEPVVVDDVAAEPSFAPWHRSALQLGFSGAVYLPLKHEADTLGVLALYSTERLRATNDELKLLRELAENLAFGIGNLRNRARQRQVEATVLKVASSVSRGTGEKFFEQLARNMAEAVGANGAFISRLVPGEPGRARTVTGVVDGKAVDNFDYAVDHSPCGLVLKQKECVIPESAAEKFPESPVAALDAEAYGGFRLDAAAGRPLGFLFVLFHDPVKRTDLITSTLQIFAARAGAELERQETDVQVREQAGLLDKARDAIIVISLDHRVLFWNKGAERLYDWTAEEALGRSIEDLLGEDHAHSPVLADGDWSGEMNRRTKHGVQLTVETRRTLISDGAGHPKSILSIDTDITRRKQVEHEIRHLALHDTLTGLPNRLLMFDRIKHAMAVSEGGHHSGALLLIDLDNFKALNDTLGHDRGDLLLLQVASRLQGCIGDSDTVARLGGDEFVVVLENLSPDPRAAALRTKVVGEHILGVMTQPFLLDNSERFISCSMGVALFSQRAGTAGDLLKRADMAMYQAKAAGRNTLRFFDPEMQTSVLARTALEAELRHAVQNTQFTLHFQPQVKADGAISGAEALLRWPRPSRGPMSPAVFVPLAEETGLIVALGQWVLDTACAQLAQWARQPATSDFCMSVNVSARQMQHPGFIEGVIGALQRAQADPHKLKLELTESLLVENVETTIAKMTELRQSGVRFSLDDFGTGYSSLAYLKRLPLDQLKIDQSFVRDILTDPSDAAIVRAVLALGNSLGLSVIAEGVETQPQCELLAQFGCDHYQGYLFSRPIPAMEFDRFVAEHSRQHGERGV